MKHTHQCPKRGSLDILRIPGKSGAYGSGNNIPVGATIFGAVLVTRCLFCGCGFSEEWIDRPEDVRKLKGRY